MGSHSAPTLSIVVPVYNLEDYLRQCVDGCLSQDYRDFELILVDDGSSDTSGAICDAYTKSDARVRVIHKKNGGAAAARNAGVEAARGGYLMFIDGDDYIEPGSIGRIMSAVESEGDTDLFFLNAVSIYPDGRKAPKDALDARCLRGKNHGDVLAYLAAHDPLPVCVWGKLIRRGLFGDGTLRFTEGIICEDVDFCLSLYMRAQTYSRIDTAFYNYRENRPGSVMSGGVMQKFNGLLFIITRWVALARTRHPGFAPHLHTILAYQYCMLLRMYGQLPRRTRATHKSDMAALSWLLSKNRDARVKAVGAACRLTGIGGGAALLVLQERLKRLIRRR